MARVIDWNTWFAESASGHETTKRRERDPDAPRYRRGTGLKVVICRADDESASYYRKANEAVGNVVAEDATGNLFTVACRY